MLKVSWKDKVKNTEVLARMAEKEPRFYKNIARQKTAYVGHVLRGSSGLNALLIMEGKISGVELEEDHEEFGLMISRIGQN